MTAPNKPADLLSAEERAYLASINLPLDVRVIIDKLAPPPAPPEPRVSELAERWRSEPTTDEERQCADELDSAMERWRERMKSEKTIDAFERKIAAATCANTMATRDAALRIIDTLLFSDEAKP